MQPHLPWITKRQPLPSYCFLTGWKTAPTLFTFFPFERTIWHRLRPVLFYNLTFTLRWLIQQCLPAQHMWLPVTPLCKPFFPFQGFCRCYKSGTTTTIITISTCFCHAKSMAWMNRVISPGFIMWAKVLWLFGCLASLDGPLVTNSLFSQTCLSHLLWGVAWAVASFSRGEGGDVKHTFIAHTCNPCLSWYHDSSWHFTYAAQQSHHVLTDGYICKCSADSPSIIITIFTSFTYAA